MTTVVTAAKEQQGQKLFAFPIQLFSDQRDIPTRLHVVPLGKWNHPVYGSFEITRNEVREFIRNFDAGIRAEARLPITAGHDVLQETPAVGWLTTLSEGANGLYADVQWTPDGERMLNEGAFKYLSPEWFVEYTDPATGAEYKHVLVGAALTNKPFFRELDAVAAFSEPSIINQFSTQTMEEINKDEVIVEDENINEEETETETEEVEEAEEVEEETEVVAEQHNASTVSISAAELKALRQKADQGHQAYSQLLTMTLENEANALVFSSTNHSGKFLPKSKGAIVSFMATLNDAQRKKFSSLVSQLPETKLFSEEGTGADETENGVEGEVAAKVQTYMEKNKVAYSVALRDVLRSDIKLAERYNEHYNN
jgi:phage I-like protein